MQPIRFIDAGVTVGERYELYRGRIRATVDAVCREMDRCGIESALAMHAACRDYSPIQGNDILLAETRISNRIRPIAGLAPATFLGTGSGSDVAEDIVGYLSTHRFAGVALYPTQHAYPLREWSSGVMLSALESMRMPLFAELSDAGADTIASILQSHPALPVVLIRIYYGADRSVYPLMDLYANLYIHSTIDRQYRGLEEYTHRFGSDRIVFASNYPVSSMGASVASVRMSGLSEDDQRQIASGTIERLQKEIRYVC